jgi:hypothetical protein
MEYGSGGVMLEAATLLLLSLRRDPSGAGQSPPCKFAVSDQGNDLLASGSCILAPF